MKGTMTLKIVAEPNVKTQVLIEKTEAEMNFTEIGEFQKMVANIQETIDKLNNYKK